MMINTFALFWFIAAYGIGMVLGTLLREVVRFIKKRSQI